MQRYEGRITKFDHERKFGFIKLHTTNKEVFFHIRAFRAGREPRMGEQVIFDIGQDKNGRPVAINIQEALFVAKKQQERQIKLQAKRAYTERQEQKHGTLNLMCAFAVGFFMVVSVFSLIGKLPVYLPVYYTWVSSISFIMHYHDKNKAKNNDWRTPESTLHTVDVLGGWIGATFAHKLLNHKAAKADFRVMFYVTIFLNIAGLLGLYFFLKA